MVKEVPLLRILITGSTGRLGRELLRVFPESYAPSRLEMDIRLRDRVHQYIARVRPDVIIHTAALTGIRQCEDDKILAWSTNVTGTENLVNSVLQFSPNAYLIFVSTACVFYGDRGGYTEDDVPNPMNYYAGTPLTIDMSLASKKIERFRLCNESPEIVHQVSL